MGKQKVAIIIGAGPGGLTLASELLERTEIKPIVLEQNDYVGGLAATFEFKGNRIDIGPHRFFSKSDRVMDWWLRMLPLQEWPQNEVRISYQNKHRNLSTAVPRGTVDDERVMLVIQRKTRIYYLRKFFDYPVNLSVATIANLGIWRTMRIGFSYMLAMLAPIKPETNLEQFMINRFGRQLYRTFFKDYTEKVWGIPCDQISAQWGAQRIKGLSIKKALLQAAKKLTRRGRDLQQKDVETSLIEQFLFPKLGAGQMWQCCADRVASQGGQIRLNVEITRVVVEDGKVTAVEGIDKKTGEKLSFAGDYFFSTMPIKHLVRALSIEVPPSIKAISEGLVYRDFVQVGVLTSRIKLTEKSETGATIPITDNWIYIQESDVKAGRMQVWNNWGGGMVADPDKIWLGVEYFCNEGDEVWSLSDEQIIALAKQELVKMAVIDSEDFLDAMVIRMPKTYPGYFGTYDRFDELRRYLDTLPNLYLIGRNGQHKYNNQDHSMLAAMIAVDNLVNGVADKENIWSVNTEEEYHEEKQASEAPQRTPAPVQT